MGSPTAPEPGGGLDTADRAALAELVPLLRRAADLDPRVLGRLRVDDAAAVAFVRLPFGVLVSRGVRSAAGSIALDVTVRAAEFVGWLDDGASLPAARDAEWRWALPPATGWARVETVPDDVVRPLVRSGALALEDAAAREGVPGAQPRAEVADALLDATVLTVDDDAGRRAEVTLRVLSAVTRMGFLPRGGQVHVDVAGRWVRVVAGHGTGYLERPGGLQLR